MSENCCALSSDAVGRVRTAARSRSSISTRYSVSGESGSASTRCRPSSWTSTKCRGCIPISSYGVVLRLCHRAPRAGGRARRHPHLKHSRCGPLDTSTGVGPPLGWAAMVTDNTDLQLALDLIGVFAFALSGGLVAVRKGLDLVGVCVLACAAGLGGGVIRDLLVGQVPPVGISDWRLVATALLAGLLTFTLHGPMSAPDVPLGRRRRLAARMVRVLDAVGLAVFAVAGSMKALSLDVDPLPAVVVGVVTAVGGGVVRDVLAGRVPEVLRRELYAIPAAIGSVIVVWADAVGALGALVAWASVILVFAIRIVAVALDLNAPRPLRTGDHP